MLDTSVSAVSAADTMANVRGRQTQPQSDTSQLHKKANENVLSLLQGAHRQVLLALGNYRH